ncbi:MAG: hypothetical protein EBX36_03565, partial [Planctomycetia bacterium]|nr:hypothetical protein [Planctomycetia bacterium]
EVVKVLAASAAAPPKADDVRIVHLDALRDWAAGLGADLVVTTLKDLVKVRADRSGRLPLLALEIALAPLPGGDLSAFDALLEPLVGRASPRAATAGAHQP